MGLTLIQRSAGQRAPKRPRIALVLAGGAVTGGAFKVGGLVALDEFLAERKVTDFELYIGLSAGAFLATSLCGGIRPSEMVEALDGTSGRISQMRPIDFYSPNLGEAVGRVARFSAHAAGYLPGLALDLLSVLPDLPDKLGDRARALFEAPSYTHLEALLMQLFREVSPKRPLPPLGSLLPSGAFDNTPLSRWLARNMAALGMPDDFAQLYHETGKKLFITATNLDTAERVLFGPHEDHGVSISEAVRASSALPGFFKPARLNGVDYVDGGVRRTANIDVAVEQGADLVICYNPFRPFLNQTRRPGRKRPHYLADRGLPTVMGQVFRTLLHSRLAMGLRSYLHDESFRGDIVVIEARESDEKFFDMNPLAFWKREEAVRHGYESVRRTLTEGAEVLAPIFRRYGLEIREPGPYTRPESAPEPSETASLKLVRGAV